jgi:hypothetical protein
MHKLTTEALFNSWQGKDIFVLSKTSELGLVPTFFEYQGLSSGVTWLGHKTDFSPTSTIKAKNSFMICWLIKYRDFVLWTKQVWDVLQFYRIRVLLGYYMV